MEHAVRTLWTALACAACCALPPAAAQQPAPPGALMPGIANGDVVMPVTSIRGLRTARTQLQKFDFSCGSAALATLLTYHFDFPVTEQAVFEEMYRGGDAQKIRAEGFSLLDMKRYLAAHGFEADGFQQPLDKLTDARIPAIALINENGYHHFVVIKGMLDNRVLVGDPAQGTRAMTRERFESIWPNRLLFVIHNRMDKARFNLAADWRAAPRAPLTSGVARDGLNQITMPKMGPGDF